MLTNTKFYRLPIDIVRTHDLTDFEKILFSILLDQAANFKNNIVAAKNNYYAEFLNKSTSSIEKALKKLKDLNLITIQTLGSKRTIHIHKDYHLYFNDPKVKSKPKKFRSKNELPVDVRIDGDMKKDIDKIFND